jgi:hypothetical protein
MMGFTSVQSSLTDLALDSPQLWKFAACELQLKKNLLCIMHTAYYTKNREEGKKG